MKRMLHLGSGPIHFPNVNGSVEWINIDKEQGTAADVVFDYLNLASYYREGTIDAIYTCHSIEHLEYPAGVVKFFEVCFKVLQPGGVLRIVVPDLMKICKAYVEGSDLKFIYGENFAGYWMRPESAAERLHFFVTGWRWEHKMCYDFNLLNLFLVDEGFVNVRECPFGHSDISELRGIDRFESESVCVEADKP